MGPVSMALLLAIAVNAGLTVASTAVPNGKQIFWVANSGHWFLPEPVAALAAEAGIQSHGNVGISRIGGSNICQHWNKGGGSNDIKDALNVGKADILTLSPAANASDECIEKFAKLAVSDIESSPFPITLIAKD
jgi:hypothetical protein